MPAHKGNKYALGNNGGRPTTYFPGIVDKVDDYLKWCEKNPIQLGHTVEEDGEHPKTTTKRETAVRLPSVAGFSRWVDIDRMTLIGWGKANKEFSASLDRLVSEQERILLEMGRAGEGNSRFAQFMLSAKHDWREKSDVTTDGKEFPVPILNVIKS